MKVAFERCNALHIRPNNKVSNQLHKSIRVASIQREITVTVQSLDKRVILESIEGKVYRMK